MTPNPCFVMCWHWFAGILVLGLAMGWIGGYVFAKAQEHFRRP